MQFNRHHSGLYLPQDFGRIVAGEEVPDGVQWPNEANYAAGMVNAVGSVQDLTGKSFDQGGLVNPPVMDQINALTATLESTTGISIGQLVGLARNVAALAQAQGALQIASAVTNVVMATVEVVTSVAKAAGAALKAFDVVPILGALVGILMDVVNMAMASQEAYRYTAEQCQKTAEQEAWAMCSSRTSATRGRATEGSAPQPADMFRPVMFALHRKQALPLTTASLYVMLCGGETRGQVAGGLNRTEWRKLVDDYKKKSGNDRIGVPQSTQRQMWALIGGLTTAANDPTPGAPIMGDNGRALMPILQDIVWNLYRVGERNQYRLPSRGGNFGIDEGFMRVLSREVTKKHYIYKECPVESDGWAKGSTPTGGESCAAFVNLAAPFVEGLREYQNQLMQVGLLNKNDLTWNVAPRRVKSSAAIKARLVIGGRAAKKLILNASTAKSAARLSTSAAAAEQRAADHTKAVVATSVVLGAGAFWGMRRYAKKR